MREIKFRAWDDELKQMFDSGTEQFDDSLLFRFQHFDTEKPVYMQYTGLKDKNEKEVFEGDIIKIMEMFISEEGRPVTEEVFHEVHFDCGGFMAGDSFLDDYWNMYGYMFEVVGNKFENPELIELS
jgi:uncharacterized phage protein (TIGR01671 family)